MASELPDQPTKPRTELKETTLAIKTIYNVLYSRSRQLLTGPLFVPILFVAALALTQMRPGSV
ncbi:MAG: hypothetical protein KAV82_10435 [Phycisphaerae bacterium]|nr:hypothetical protein [Phycisphaerae bacterium]